jgi:hypothetical protein
MSKKDELGPAEHAAIARATGEAYDLFEKHSQELGEETAQEIFIMVAGRHSKSDANMLARWDDLARYDRLGPKPNVAQLARELSAEGRGMASSVETYIRRIVRDRKRAIANGTWNGPKPRE